MAEHESISEPIVHECAKLVVPGQPMSVGSRLDQVHQPQGHTAHGRREGENQKAYEYFRDPAGQESQLGSGQHGAASVTVAERERAELQEVRSHGGGSRLEVLGEATTDKRLHLKLLTLIDSLGVNANF